MRQIKGYDGRSLKEYFSDHVFDNSEYGYIKLIKGLQPKELYERLKKENFNTFYNYIIAGKNNSAVAIIKKVGEELLEALLSSSWRNNDQGEPLEEFYPFRAAAIYGQVEMLKILFAALPQNLTKTALSNIPKENLCKDWITRFSENSNKELIEVSEKKKFFFNRKTEGKSQVKRENLAKSLSKINELGFFPDDDPSEDIGVGAGYGT